MSACSSFKRRQNIASWKPWAQEDIPWGHPLKTCNHGNLVSQKLMQSFAMAEIGSFNRDWITKSENPRIFRHSCVRSLLHLSKAADRSQFSINNFLSNFLAFSMKHFSVKIPSRVEKPRLYAQTYPGRILLLCKDDTILLTIVASATFKTADIRLIGRYFLIHSLLDCCFF